MAEDAVTRLYHAFLANDAGLAIAVIETTRASGVEQDRLFDQLFAPAVSLLGGAWARGDLDEYAFTTAAVVAEQVISFVTTSPTAGDTGITVLAGTMQGDGHHTSKTIIAAALAEAGHRVVDLGSDVRPAVFLERAEETGAPIVIVFAETTEAAAEVSRVREMFSAAERTSVALLVCGGPFAADEARARAVGANGVIRGAESALRLVQQAAERLGVAT
jgi:methanogenic corrinoid protein MtbC1